LDYGWVCTWGCVSSNAKEEQDHHQYKENNNDTQPW